MLKIDLRCEKGVLLGSRPYGARGGPARDIEGVAQQDLDLRALEQV